MNDETQKILFWIISERLKIKSQLNLLSSLSKEKRVHNKEIDYLLDRLSYLGELEEKVKKMK